MHVQGKKQNKLEKNIVMDEGRIGLKKIYVSAT
jgi:hypothetical protein